MIEEKFSEKISILLSKTQEKKLNTICRIEDRPVSQMVRRILENYMEKVMDR